MQITQEKKKMLVKKKNLTIKVIYEEKHTEVQVGWQKDFSTSTQN